MFIGVSKNIGGFNFGIGTKIGKPKAKNLKTEEFNYFLSKVKRELNAAAEDFVEANGYSVELIENKNLDIRELFKDNPEFAQFSELMNSTKKTINKILFVGDNSVVAKREITEEVFRVKEFIEQTYPDYQRKPRVARKSAARIKALKQLRQIGMTLGIVFLPIVFAWFTLRKGYPKMVKMAAFSWLVFTLIMISADDDSSSQAPREINTEQKSRLLKLLEK